MKLYIENLQKNYEKKRVLDIEKLQFDEGKIYAILGLNGSGKSTLLECISGLLEYDSGRIIYETGSHLERVKDRISIMTQFNYMFNNSVRENLELGLRFKKYDRKTIDERVSKYINYFNFEGLLDKNAKRLSGGEGARTALIRIAVLESEITLLDEPTANMDFESTLIAEDIIRTMKANNRLAIVVTHDLYQAQRLADEVVFMDRGKIIEQGPGGEVFSNPQNALLRRILNKE